MQPHSPILMQACHARLKDVMMVSDLFTQVKMISAKPSWLHKTYVQGILHNVYCTPNRCNSGVLLHKVLPVWD